MSTEYFAVREDAISSLENLFGESWYYHISKFAENNDVDKVFLLGISSGGWLFTVFLRNNPVKIRSLQDLKHLICSDSNWAIFDEYGRRYGCNEINKVIDERLGVNFDGTKASGGIYDMSKKLYIPEHAVFVEGNVAFVNY